MKIRKRNPNSKFQYYSFLLTISYRTELEFRETEKELRHKDLEIQESMIQFSVFLQDNEKKKQKAKEKIEAENKETAKLEAEITLKKK